MTATETRPPEHPRHKPSAEARSWAFMRLSGLLLLFFALVHFSITHIVNDVVDTDYDFVAERWHNPAWRVFDWMLLVLALSHGLNGLRWIVDDYVRTPSRNRAVKGLLYALTAVLVVVGTITILIFPSAPR